MIFSLALDCGRNIFLKSSQPPPPQKSNDPPLRTFDDLEKIARFLRNLTEELYDLSRPEQRSFNYFTITERVGRLVLI